MVKKERSRQRREESLSRERIVEASIELLDESGEAGLTFRALSERLVTGPGAIYWHIANKDELFAAACDAVVARIMSSVPASLSPEEAIRTIGLAIFGAIDDHPWLGSALTRVPGKMPIVRLFEPIGQQIRAMGVPAGQQRPVVWALASYILGSSSQNAANRQRAQSHGLDRSEFLQTLAISWSELDPNEFPFASSIAGEIPGHDDRADFLAGIDLILRGAKT